MTVKEDFAVKEILPVVVEALEWPKTNIKADVVFNMRKFISLMEKKFNQKITR